MNPLLLQLHHTMTIQRHFLRAPTSLTYIQKSAPKRYPTKPLDLTVIPIAEHVNRNSVRRCADNAKTSLHIEI